MRHKMIASCKVNSLRIDRAGPTGPASPAGGQTATRPSTCTAGREAWITGSNKVNSDELTDPVMTTYG